MGGSARAAAPGQEPARPGPGLWCPHCGGRVLLAAGTAVHEATLARQGADGHRAGMVTGEPPLWRAAREIAADYGGLFLVSARFGFLRADWAGAAGRANPVHYEADGEEGLRRQLDEAAGLLRQDGAR